MFVPRCGECVVEFVSVSVALWCAVAELVRRARACCVVMWLFDGDALGGFINCVGRAVGGSRRVVAREGSPRVRVVGRRGRWRC